MQVALDGKGRVLETLGPLRAELSGESRGEVARNGFQSRERWSGLWGGLKRMRQKKWQEQTRFISCPCPMLQQTSRYLVVSSE